jgi:hypothetical protein
MPRPSENNDSGITITHSNSAGPSLPRVYLPPDFTAFCLLYAHHYLHYARLRLKDLPASEAAVERALGDLATAWSTALGSPHPAAFGWQSL